MNSIEDGSKISYFKIFFLGIIISLPCLLGGFTEGYATLALPQMNLPAVEASWFSSVPGFAAPVGAIILSILVDAIGRKGAVLAGIVSHFLGWCLLAWNYSMVTVILGRILTGLTLGSLFYPTQVYAAECLTVHHNRLRSSLATWNGITNSLGLFVVILFTYFFDYQVTSALAAIVALVLLVVIAVIVPESPSWLYLQGRIGDAEISTMRLGIRKSIVNGARGEAALVPKDRSHKFSWISWLMNLRKLLRKDVYKPTLILTFACVVLSLSGAHAILVYQVDIIGPNPNANQTGAAQDRTSYASKASVVSGALVLAAHICTTVALPVLGVRKITIPSCISMAVGLILLGYTMEQQQDTDLFVWRSVVVLVITFVHQFGVQMSPLAVLSDSFPADAKGFAGIPILGLVVSSGAVVKVHPFLFANLGGRLYYIYAGIGFLGTFYVMAFLHETVGKSLEEIGERYRR